MFNQNSTAVFGGGSSMPMFGGESPLGMTTNTTFTTQHNNNASNNDDDGDIPPLLAPIDETQAPVSLASCAAYARAQTKSMGVVAAETSRRMQQVHQKMRLSLDQINLEKGLYTEDGFRLMCSVAEASAQDFFDVMLHVSQDPELLAEQHHNNIVNNNISEDEEVPLVDDVGFRCASVWDFFRILFLSDATDLVGGKLMTWYHNFFVNGDLPHELRERDSLVAQVLDASLSEEERSACMQRLVLWLTRFTLLHQGTLVTETLEILTASRVCPDVDRSLFSLLNSTLVPAALVHADSHHQHHWVPPANLPVDAKYYVSYGASAMALATHAENSMISHTQDHPLYLLFRVLNQIGVVTTTDNDDDVDPGSIFDDMVDALELDWLERVIISIYWRPQLFSSSSASRRLSRQESEYLNPARVSSVAQLFESMAADQVDSDWMITPLLPLLARIRRLSMEITTNEEEEDQRNLNITGALSLVKLFAYECERTLESPYLIPHLIEMMSIFADLSPNPSETQSIRAQALCRYAQVLTGQEDPLLRVAAVHYALHGVTANHAAMSMGAMTSLPRYFCAPFADSWVLRCDAMDSAQFGSVVHEPNPSIHNDHLELVAQCAELVAASRLPSPCLTAFSHAVQVLPHTSRVEVLKFAFAETAMDSFKAAQQILETGVSPVSAPSRLPVAYSNMAVFQGDSVESQAQALARRLLFEALQASVELITLTAIDAVSSANLPFVFRLVDSILTKADPSLWLPTLSDPDCWDLLSAPLAALSNDQLWKTSSLAVARTFAFTKQALQRFKKASELESQVQGSALASQKLSTEKQQCLSELRHSAASLAGCLPAALRLGMARLACAQVTALANLNVPVLSPHDATSMRVALASYPFSDRAVKNSLVQSLLACQTTNEQL